VCGISREEFRRPDWEPLGTHGLARVEKTPDVALGVVSRCDRGRDECVRRVIGKDLCGKLRKCIMNIDSAKKVDELLELTIAR